MFDKVLNKYPVIDAEYWMPGAFIQSTEYSTNLSELFNFYPPWNH